MTQVDEGGDGSGGEGGAASPAASAPPSASDDDRRPPPPSSPSPSPSPSPPSSVGDLSSDVPRWRFPSTAKKSMGYSSRSAGSHVPGRSAEELGAMYVAPADESVVSHDDDTISTEYIGSVVVPSHLLGGHDEEEGRELMRPRMKTRQSWQPAAAGLNERDEEEDGDGAGGIGGTGDNDRHDVEKLEAQRLVDELRVETQRMQNEQDCLSGDMPESGWVNDVFEGGVQGVREGYEEMPVSRKAQANADVDALQTVKNQAGDARAYDGGYAVPTSNVGSVSEGADDEDRRLRQATRKTRALYATILVLLGVIAALLGIMFSGTNEGNDASPINLHGDSLNDTAVEEAAPTGKPTASPMTSPGKARLPTSSPTPSAAEDALLVPDESALACPSGSKEFELTLFLSDPSEASWVLLERCDVEIYHSCIQCHASAAPDHPVSFSGCLPSYNNDTLHGREYVLQLIDLSVNGNSTFGYTLRYEGTVVAEGERGGFSLLTTLHFGDGGCSNAPSESPVPTPLPTDAPVTPYPTIGINITRGCNRDTVASGTCGRKADVEFKLLQPRGMGELENRLFGSSVAFVGSGRRIIAVGSGVPDSPVRIYHKPPSDDDAWSSWEYLTSINVPEDENSTGAIFGASVVSNAEGFIAVGAPTTSGTGRVHVFRPDSNMTYWKWSATLAPSDSVTFAPSFGAFVAMDGKLIAVGSPDEWSSRGSVYVFEHMGEQYGGNVWVQAAKLSPSSVAGDAGFGSSVSLHGNDPATLAVGAPFDTGGGAVFVYTRVGFDWLPQRLSPRGIDGGDQFGSDVVLSGCTIAVSSPKDGASLAFGSGTVRTFDWDGDSGSWIYSQVLEPTIDDLSGDGVFGKCIAMEGDTMLVGSPGAIHHFERIGGLWSRPISVISHETIDEDFGCPLSLSGDSLFVVGSRGDSALGPNSGAAFIYDLCPDVVGGEPLV